MGNGHTSTDSGIELVDRVFDPAEHGYSGTTLFFLTA
jgi:hypothetical protein